MSVFSNLFASGIKYDKETVVRDDIYPFNIPLINSLNELRFNKPVTFFIGENGGGKLTVIESVAVGLKPNPEGGSQNFTFKTKDTHSNLSKANFFSAES